MSTVYTTAGGRRFHADPACEALCNGRWVAGWVPGPWGGHDGGSLYPLEPRVPRVAVQRGFTACRVCVPPALALPATGRTHGHEPVNMWPNGLVCARCYTETRHAAYDEPDDVEPEQWTDLHAVPWPCASAVVLGLVPRGAAS